MARDPVCGKEVDAAKVDAPVGTVMAGAPKTDPTAGTKRFHDGKWYYFCSMACRQRFISNPDMYLAETAP